jgi:hypothetical protein
VIAKHARYPAYFYRASFSRLGHSAGTSFIMLVATRQSPPDLFNARARREGWCSVCDPALAFECQDLAEVVAIWQAMRAGRALPTRADFTARSLARQLRNIIFVERVHAPAAERRYRFGFFGSGVARWMGDRTGKFIDEVIPAPYTEIWHISYDMATEWRRPLRFVSTLRSLNLEYLSTETAAMPLADESGAVTGFLVSAAFTPQVPQTRL